jgi:hypothetical protein
MSGKYDTSWDLVESSKGNLPKNQKALDLKYTEWAERDWVAWLKSNLSFPFKAKREEDEDDAYFTDVANHKPFRLGHTMEVVGVEDEDGAYGVLVEVKEGKSKGSIPLADLEVTPKTDKNFWPVREYVVWMANH